MSAEPTVADVLNRAADIIEEHGLCRGGPRGLDGSVCAVIAISDASFQCDARHLFYDARQEVEDLVNPGVNVPGARLNNVAVWSDTKALDGADVANHLRKAAERWAERS